MKTENKLAEKIEKLLLMLKRDPGYCVLTGAGCSTASGLPAYRDVKGDWQHQKPMQHQEFTACELKRKIYWARSQQGWPTFNRARPNQTHKMLELLQRGGYVQQIITQNVDRLHQASGSKAVIDLHGRLDQVVCLDCTNTFSRKAFQRRLTLANRDYCPAKNNLRPDGDIEVNADTVSDFSIPKCENCGGDLKPDVIFFGGVLNRQTATDALDAIDNAPGLLVIGSSLMVYSGFRLVKRTLQLNKPVVIINRGATRADDLYTLKINHESGQVLTAVSTALLKF